MSIQRLEETFIASSWALNLGEHLEVGFKGDQ